jgi:CBS domain-containing protein
VTNLLRYTPGKVDWAGSGFPTEGEQAAGVQAAPPRAIDVLDRDVPRCRLDERMGDVRERVRGSGWGFAVVLNDAGVVLGLVSGGALDGETDAVVESVMDLDPKTVRPSTALADVGHSVLVTTPDGVLLGALKQEVRP